MSFGKSVCVVVLGPRGGSITKDKFMTCSDRSPNANRGLTPKPTSTNVSLFLEEGHCIVLWWHGQAATTKQMSCVDVALSQWIMTGFEVRSGRQQAAKITSRMCFCGEMDGS